MAGQGVTPDVPVAASTNAYRGTDNDADVLTAMQVIRQGIPAQWLAGNVNVVPNIGQSFPVNYPANSQSQLPMGVREY